MSQLSTSFKPQLIKVGEAAALLRVSTSTIHNWIENEAIPYIKLPGNGKRAEYRIPLRGLVASLSGNYNLAADLDTLAAAAAAAGLDVEAAVAATGGMAESVDDEPDDED